MIELIEFRLLIKNKSFDVSADVESFLTKTETKRQKNTNIFIDENKLSAIIKNYKSYL